MDYNRFTLILFALAVITIVIDIILFDPKNPSILLSMVSFGFLFAAALHAQWIRYNRHGKEGGC